MSRPRPSLGGAIWCGAVRVALVWGGVLWCGVVWCSALSGEVARVWTENGWRNRLKGRPVILLHMYT